ncbi:unnamed protein product [Sphagnum troendelagicum]|uniref:Mediator of RNA polymerase II transcription subunit 16 n=1 Tax=Sphagnum troendelagicum TaxID=128251 RepID=A0ABP0TLH7_9BRYO
MNPAAERDGESTIPWRAMAVVEGGTRKQQEDGQQQQEEKEELEEEELDNTILQVTLHPSSFVRLHKMSFPELCKSFSAVAWCAKTNLICCAVETCASDQGSGPEPAFWIPVHVVDPERPTEHSILNVPADTPGDTIQFLEWSPNLCPRALLIGNSGGRVTIWTQPTQGVSSIGSSSNRWSCEHEWRQEQSIITKWVPVMSPYRWTAAASSSKTSFEERFLHHQPRADARWPSFLCVCSVFWSGTVQLHWRQWPGTTPKWLATKKGVLGAGPSGVFSGDITVSEAGALLVAGAPVGNPSTVVIWEVTPWGLNSSGGTQQVAVKPTVGMQLPLLATPPSWLGIAPLAAYLLSWQEQASGEIRVEGEDYMGPLLQCSVVSNFSAYINPEASASSGWGSGVSVVAFDPSSGGNALITVIVEGYYISPEDPDAGPSATGWRIQRWESVQKPVVIHALLDSAGSPPAMMTTWTAVVNNTINKGVLSNGQPMNQQQKKKRERPMNPRAIGKASFSAHGGEVAIAIFGGEVHVFSGVALTPVDVFSVQVMSSHLAAPAFSPTSCCLASVWHDHKSDTCMLRIVRIPPVTASAPLTWDRHLADRFWWSLVSEVDWWDAVACTQCAADDGTVTHGRVMAMLDADFHNLNSVHRQYYGPAMDRIKCRILEGVEAADVRVLVLDMQGRLMLDMLGHGIEAALVNPSTLIPEPWQASNERLTGLGVDAMAVDPALVPTVQAYVDAILDLASHFLTRLRRYASFCRTLATAHAAASNAASTTPLRPSTAPSTATIPPVPTTPGVQTGTTSNGGTAQLQAWVQGAIAKITATSPSAEVPASAAISSTILVGPVVPLPMNLSTATFPGTPAVRLIGDCHFLHRLCQLLLFCLIFRKRQLLRFVGGVAGRTSESITKVGPLKEEVMTGVQGSPTTVVKVEDGGQIPNHSTGTITKGSEEVANTRSARVGYGNCGQGYSSEEVKHLFLVLVDLCKRTAQLAHPLPKSQVGNTTPIPQLHFIDGQFSVAPEVVEASLGPHMQKLPRPRGADAPGLLMRELELHPPSEEWNRRTLSGGPWSGMLEAEVEVENLDPNPIELWPRKRRRVEHDAGFGLRTVVGLSSFSTLLGSRRDVISSVWKPAGHGIWHKCLRCGRQTASLSMTSNVGAPSQTVKEIWSGRWAFGCPMCGGQWCQLAA